MSTTTCELCFASEANADRSLQVEVERPAEVEVRLFRRPGSSDTGGTLMVCRPCADEFGCTPVTR